MTTSTFLLPDFFLFFMFPSIITAWHRVPTPPLTSSVNLETLFYFCISIFFCLLCFAFMYNKHEQIRYQFTNRLNNTCGTHYCSQKVLNKYHLRRDHASPGSRKFNPPSESISISTFPHTVHCLFFCFKSLQINNILLPPEQRLSADICI